MPLNQSALNDVNHELVQVLDKLHAQAISLEEAVTLANRGVRIALTKHAPVGSLFRIRCRISSVFGEWNIAPEVSGITAPAIAFLRDSLGLENIHDEELHGDWAHNPTKEPIPREIVQEKVREGYFTVLGACPDCEAPIVTVSQWEGILPAPVLVTCNCVGDTQAA